MQSNYGPKVNWAQMIRGVRVHYTGDMANPSGAGRITRVLPIDPRWGYRQVNIRLDDGRLLRGIGIEQFQPAPGRRFWLETDWQADRATKIAAAAEHYRKVLETRASRGLDLA